MNASGWLAIVCGVLSAATLVLAWLLGRRMGRNEERATYDEARVRREWEANEAEADEAKRAREAEEHAEADRAEALRRIVTEASRPAGLTQAQRAIERAKAWQRLRDRRRRP